ncbi:Rec8 like protein-domain-containing protein [Schizophyllum amplum]|uniref:Rec8 like protein-domain-containing protein n=1 Tax=Schizophyllum amplum TaxID=97359 RepID=A0A550C6E2_9AGAR|nr:Rec8 like protein-domain-containing protein [Auriculariopsis ampla]
MFFTQELLSKRDSGFGLLWLAATLGSRSAFKKLPKRSVLTADIAQLCDLIAEPIEPLALRLSSNLMVGVARVYKVKQEMFFTDVTNCVTSLKKVVIELKSLNDDQLQMAQPTVRAGAVTLTSDPKNTYAMDFDALVADWDDFLNINRGSDDRMDVDDDDYDPKAGRKGKGKGAAAVPEHETVRADKHMLQEHHDHLLSASYDFSFSGPDNTSSQADNAFILNEDIFGAPDAFDLGGLGDELARELGEGWGASPTRAGPEPAEFDNDFPMEVDMGQPFDLGDIPEPPRAPDSDQPDHSAIPETPRKKRTASARAKENQPPSSARRGSRPPSRALTPRGVSPATSFSRLFLSQEEGQVPLLETTRKNDEEQAAQAPKKLKRTRLLLDARTELTDEELRTARTQYLEGQALLKKEQAQKQAEKASEKMIEELVSGPPSIVQAPALADFMQEVFRIQFEALSGDSDMARDGRSSKRRRLSPVREEDEEGRYVDADNMYPDMDMGAGMPPGIYDEDQRFFEREDPDRHSSEDPGQARRMSSRPASQLGFYDAQAEVNLSSQRSSFFPWDHAGFMSSSGAPLLPGEGSDKISVDQVSIRLPGRNSSLGPRDASLGGSLPGSAVGGPGGSAIAFSPGPVGDDFRFEVDAIDGAANESQVTDANLITLEKNSFNFLEWVARCSFVVMNG